MEYKYECECGNVELKDIPMSEYEKVRNEQTCSKCGKKMKRVIEWSGVASGSGDGWFGKSNGSKTI